MNCGELAVTVISINLPCVFNGGTKISDVIFVTVLVSFLVCKYSFEKDLCVVISRVQFIHVCPVSTPVRVKYINWCSSQSVEDYFSVHFFF